MSTLEIIATIAGSLLMIGGCVWWGLWYSRRSRDRLQERVARAEEVFAQVATRLGLAFQQGEVYEHPTAGRFPSFPVVSGSMRERRVQIRVESESAGDTGRDDRMAVVVSPSVGAGWAARGKLHARRRDLAPEATRALADLAPSVRSVDLDESWLRLFPRGDESGSGLAGACELLLDPDALEQLVRAALALAELPEESSGQAAWNRPMHVLSIVLAASCLALLRRIPARNALAKASRLRQIAPHTPSGGVMHPARRPDRGVAAPRRSGGPRTYDARCRGIGGRSRWAVPGFGAVVLGLACCSPGPARPVTRPVPAHQPVPPPPPTGGTTTDQPGAPAPSWVILPCDPNSARAPSSFVDLVPDPAGVWTLDVRFDPWFNDWMPVNALPMPLHHASRIEWVDDPPHDELTAHERVLRIAFVVLESRLEPSRRSMADYGVLVEATYRLDVISVCEP